MKTIAVVAVLLCAACKQTPVTLWVDGFVPEHISFDVKDLGTVDDAALAARADIDGVLRLPEGACVAACEASEISVYIHNRTTEPMAPPVIRLDVPDGKPRRLPLAVRAVQIDPGRTGRLRFVVFRWPDEKQLTATLSQSVAVDVNSVGSP